MRIAGRVYQRVECDSSSWSSWSRVRGSTQMCVSKQEAQYLVRCVIAMTWSCAAWILLCVMIVTCHHGHAPCASSKCRS